jgi:hypothetical protein
MGLSLGMRQETPRAAGVADADALGRGARAVGQTAGKMVMGILAAQPRTFKCSVVMEQRDMVELP